jgi:hypothetical protein
MWIARIFGAAVGLVLFVAGVAKAADLELFMRQIRDYGLFNDRPLLAVSAWGLVAFECGLGVALLTAYRPRVIVPVATALMVLFLGATGWAWATGATENCGCFGAWAKRTPAQAAGEDILLLGALAAAWIGFARRTPRTRNGKGWPSVLGCLIGLALPLAFGFSPSDIQNPQEKEVLLGDLAVQGLDVDLKQGEHLVVLIDTDCTHCQESVPQINDLAATSELPPLVALCKNEEWQRAFFTQRFQAAFPMGQISEKEFLRLLAAGETPRLLLIQNQRVKKTWDKTMPSKEIIQSARRSS